MQSNSPKVQFQRSHYQVKLQFDRLQQTISIQCISEKLMKKFTLVVLNNTLPPVAQVIFQDTQATFSYIQAHKDHTNLIYINQKSNLQIVYQTIIGKAEKKRIILFQLHQTPLNADIIAQKNQASSLEQILELKSQMKKLSSKLQGSESQDSMMNKIKMLQKQMSSYARYNQAMSIRIEELQRQNQHNQKAIKQLKASDKKHSELMVSLRSLLLSHNKGIETLNQKTEEIEKAVIKLLKVNNTNLNHSSSFRQIPTMRPNPFCQGSQQRVQCQNQ